MLTSDRSELVESRAESPATVPQGHLEGYALPSSFVWGAGASR
jgi:hypothetical protein